MVADPNVRKFLNEVLRPQADQLAGIIAKPTAFITQFNAKEIAEALSIPGEFLTRETPLLNADYASVSGEALDDGRAEEGVVQITPREVLAFYRIIKFLEISLNADPSVSVLANRIAINPRG